MNVIIVIIIFVVFLKLGEKSKKGKAKGPNESKNIQTQKVLKYHLFFFSFFNEFSINILLLLYYF